MKNYIVIGVGRMGSRHADNLYKKRVPGARLVAVVDTDPKALAAFTARHKVPGFTDLDKCLQSVSVDAAVIAVPHYSHVPIAVGLIEKGIAVLTEKPEAVDIAEAARLNAVAEKHPEVLFGIVYNQRTNPCYRFAKRVIDNGGIGDIKRITLVITDWYRSQHYYDMGGWRASWTGEGGGLLINQCVHQLDVLQWLIGLPESIDAVANTKGRDIYVENEVSVRMRYADGAEGVFIASANELKGTNILEIAGDKGKLSVGKYKAKYYSFSPSEREVNATAKKGYGKARISRKSKSYGLFRLIYDGIYGQQIRVLKGFTKALNGDKAALVAPGTDGIKALSFINSVYLSAYTGKRVPCPPDPQEYVRCLENMKADERKGVRAFAKGEN